jgi:hypothetical protein
VHKQKVYHIPTITSSLTTDTITKTTTPMSITEEETESTTTTTNQQVEWSNTARRQIFVERIEK